MLIPKQKIVTSAMICSNTFVMTAVISCLMSKSLVKTIVTVLVAIKVTNKAVVYSVFRVILSNDIIFLLI